MELKGKALYNLLRISWLEDPSITVKPWQVEDYRSLSEEQLLSRLADLGIVLNGESFLMYAENCDTPEDLVECLWLDDENLERRDQTFLILCELWRRYLPQKQSLSLFCDHLDQMIELYDKGELGDEEPLQQALIELEDMLDETADLGGEGKEIFQDVALYCAHDLEDFIYDYISDHIESGNILYASELLDAFYEYISDVKRFDFLRARVFVGSELAEGDLLIARLLEQLQDEPDLNLLLEVAHYLVTRGDTHLFIQAVKQTIPLLKQEEEFQQLLRQIAAYFRCLDKEKEEKEINALLEKRQTLPLDRHLDPADQALKHISCIF